MVSGLGMPCQASRALIGGIQLQGSSRGLIVAIEADREFPLSVSASRQGSGTTLKFTMDQALYGLPRLSYQSFPSESPAKSLVVKDGAAGGAVEIELHLSGITGITPNARQKQNSWLILISKEKFPDFSWNAPQAEKQKSKTSAASSSLESPKPASAEVPKPKTAESKAKPPVVKSSVLGVPAKNKKKPRPSPSASAPARNPRVSSNQSHGAKENVANLRDIKLLRRGSIEEIIFEFDTPVRMAVKRQGKDMMLAFVNARSLLPEERLQDVRAGFFTKVASESVKRSNGNLLRVTLSETPDDEQLVIEPRGTQIVVGGVADAAPGLMVWTASSGKRLEYSFADIEKRQAELKQIKQKAVAASGRELQEENTFALRAPAQAKTQSSPKKRMAKAEKKRATPQGEAPTAQMNNKRKSSSSTKKEPSAAEETEKKSKPTPPRMAMAETKKNQRKAETSPKQQKAPVVEANTSEPDVRLVVIKDGVNFRSEPSTAGKTSIIGQLEIGTIGTELEKKGSWHKMATDQSTGWIYSSLVKDSAAVREQTWEKIAEKRASEKASGEDIIASLEQNAPGTPEKLQTGTPKTETDSPKALPENQAETAKPIPEPKPTVPRKVTYTMRGRDPFLALKADDGPADLADLDRVRLVGVLFDNDDRVALLEQDGDKGSAYALREGDAVKKGKVLRIQREKVFFLITEFGLSRTIVLGLEKDKTSPSSMVAKGPASYLREAPSDGEDPEDGRERDTEGTRSPSSAGSSSWTEELPPIK